MRTLIIDKNNPFNEKKKMKMVAISKIFVEPILNSLSEQ